MGKEEVCIDDIDRRIDTLTGLAAPVIVSWYPMAAWFGSGSAGLRSTIEPYASVVLRYGTALFAIFLFCASHYINRSFGKPDLDQIAYHLSYGVDAMSSADPLLVWRSCAGACLVRWR